MAEHSLNRIKNCV